MQSLPSEILRLLPKHLDMPSLWSFARTCSTVHTICRPSLYRHVSFRFHIDDAGKLDSEQMKRYMAILAGSWEQQMTGSLVHTLVVTFSSGSNEVNVDPVQAGVLKALTAFLGTTPKLQSLVLLDVPCHTVARKASDWCPHIPRFQQRMLQLACLQVLEFKSADYADSSWWLEFMLAAIPPTLRGLRLGVDFSGDTDVEELLARLQTKYTSSADVLWYTCPQMGRASDQIMAFLICSTPSLSTIHIYDQYLSDTSAIELFSHRRTHETLYLKTLDVPHLAECRAGLQTQLHLKHVEVDAGSDFLYYLAFLPPGIKMLSLYITISTSSSQETEVSCSLESAWAAVKPCLEDPAWCPNLAVLQIRLQTSSQKEVEYYKQAEAAEGMRKRLLGVLGRRKVVPRTDASFWVLHRR